ncbi:hypothetical protein BDQ12DRAFT_706594 [Crucibulum laeve]|uniref:Uncharacterized protein n=1 Tax=Crucibulum laeve TaxID=68775 RepID=A0A5C3M3R3_9AGAR|nr:hypothetical protein BDQ12DRAFT_706594 [Crucibulum laeve]
MATAFSDIQLVPSENWDDDFEFQLHSAAMTSSQSAHTPTKGKSKNYKSKNDVNTTPINSSSKARMTNDTTNHNVYDDFEPELPSARTRMSTASSAFTEDWDAENSETHSPTRRSHENALGHVNTFSSPPPPSPGAFPSPPPLFSHLPLSDTKNFVSGSAHSSTHNLAVTTPELTEWVEPGPSTPSKSKTRFPAQPVPEQETENWDDDFEDGPESPVRKGTTPGKKSLSGRRVPSAPSTSAAGKASRRIPSDEQHESWDDEFALDSPSPPKKTSRSRTGSKLASPPASPGRRRRRSSAAPPLPTQQHPLAAARDSSEDEHPQPQRLAYPPSDDEDEEFGYADKEEDRTVTARSRRAALSRLTTTANGSPPPPVPALPLPFQLASHTTTTGLGIGIPHPFPRSPTSSVFSVPASIADGRSSNPASSTTLLRPISSRGSSGGGASAAGLAGLPPSPPIHKERERRRLRKKSRPVREGVYELGSIQPPGSNNPSGAAVGRAYEYRYQARYSFSDGELPEQDEEPYRPRTPSPSPSPVQTHSRSRSYVGLPSATATQLPGRMTSAPLQLQVPSTPSNKASVTKPQPGVASPTGSTKGALLSRIGSVGRWGVRRKRGGSVTPSEVVAAETPVRTDHPYLNEDPHRTPRPQSSHSHSSSSIRHSSASGSSHGHPHLPLPSTSTSNANSRSTSNTTASNTSPGSQQQQVPSQSKNSNNHWFFRSASGHGPGGGSSVGSYSASASGHEHGSMTDLSVRDAVVYTPSPESGRGGGGVLAGMFGVGGSGTGKKDGASVPTTPSKLVKRKSLGFVQLRRGFGGHGGNGGNDRVEDVEGSGGSGGGKRPVSMMPRASLGAAPPPLTTSGSGSGHVAIAPPTTPNGRHAAYGGLGLGRAGRRAMGSVDDLSEREREKREREAAERDRKRSFSRSRSKDVFGEKPDVVEKGKEKEEKDGSRGFMGSVRRISLVGRHKRTKSGVSLSNVGELPRVPSQTLPPAETPRHRSPASVKRSLDTESFRPSTDRSEDPHPPLPFQHRTPTKSPRALLPPIELQPPSPPRANASPSSGSQATMSGFDAVLSPSSSSSSALTTPRSPTGKSPGTPGKLSTSPKGPGSPQAASLGRSTIGPGTASGSPSGSGSLDRVPRRNSLGDLKIPARISQAQVGLRRDLGMVRDFAANVEQLKELQNVYHTLVGQIQGTLDAHAHMHALQQQQQSARASSPTFFKKRTRSNTNPGPPPPTAPQLAYKELASAFYTINSKYRISWECAELLIELGSGSGGVSTSPPPSSASGPPSVIGDGSVKKGRERAITLAGDESKPPTPTPGAASSSPGPSTAPSPPFASPPSLSWRASTGRHDLSHRQLVLLREMLNNADSSLMDEANISIPEESTTSLHIQRDWRWGDPMSSTVTLYSEDSSPPIGRVSPAKKRRGSRLGMTGLRDMLRSLKRHQSDSTAPPVPVMPASSTSISTNSSHDSHTHRRLAHTQASGQSRRPKSSIGPESLRAARDPRPTTPYSPSSLSAKPSPRRPSLASIFRLGQKSKTSPPASTAGDVSAGSADYHGTVSRSSGQESSSTGEEEDWDRMDSASDLDAAAKALGIGNDGAATVRGKKGRSPYLQQDSYLPPGARPITPKRSISGSQSSLWGTSPFSTGLPPRSTRLSNVEEHADDHRPSRTSSKRPMSRSSKLPQSGSVRSMPPQQQLPDPKLAMTPENIKPLLENTREVHARLTECISEIRSLLTTPP